jgi:hypothetical protein
MDWFERSKELIGIAIAAVAVVLSLVTVLIQRRQQRHHAFQQIHDILMTPEHQRGRWLMWDVARTGRLPDQGSLFVLTPVGGEDYLIRTAERGPGGEPSCWQAKANVNKPLTVTGATCSTTDPLQRFTVTVNSVGAALLLRGMATG